jgi:acyl-CoA dehydrogenase
MTVTDDACHRYARLNLKKVPMQTTHSDEFQDIREAVRDLCQQFSGDYFRKIDEARDHPETFVDALTKAGWLAALIPQEYGGSSTASTRNEP